MPKPSLFDFAGKAKWDAWKSAGDTYKDRPADAEARYIEIAKSLGWTEGSTLEAKHPVSKEENTRNEGAVDGNDEEDIWDKSDDEGVRKERSGESAMGRITSTMVTEDTGNANALSNIAVVGDAEGLLEYLQSHPDANVNALDENVSSFHVSSVCCYIRCRGIRLYISPLTEDTRTSSKFFWRGVQTRVSRYADLKLFLVTNI